MQLSLSHFRLLFVTAFIHALAGCGIGTCWYDYEADQNNGYIHLLLHKNDTLVPFGRFYQSEVIYPSRLALKPDYDNRNIAKVPFSVLTDSLIVRVVMDSTSDTLVIAYTRQVEEYSHCNAKGFHVAVRDAHVTRHSFDSIVPSVDRYAERW